AAAVPGVDPVPLVPRPGGQGPAEGVRPLRDLPADRRHLYAVHADRPARAVGVGPVRRHLDPGPGRGGVQALLHRPLQAPVHVDLRRHGLAGAGGDQAGAGGAGRLDLRLAGRRGAVLYPGHGLLPPRVDPLLARDLAPVLHRRQRLPLCRGDGPGGDAALSHGVLSSASSHRGAATPWSSHCRSSPACCWPPARRRPRNPPPPSRSPTRPRPRPSPPTARWSPATPATTATPSTWSAMAGWRGCR